MNSNKLKNIPAALLALVVGVIILYLAVPRTMAAFLKIPGDPILNNMQMGKEVSPEELEYLTSTRKRALAWLPEGRTWTDMGMAQSLMAYKIGHQSEEGKKLLTESIASLKNGLALAPANPFAWARLGYAELIKAGRPNSSAANALKMSLLTAVYEPRLLVSRLELCLTVWEYLDDEGRDLVAKQVSLATRREPAKLAEIANRNNAAVSIIRDTLSKYPEELEKFEEHYRNLIVKNG